MIELKDVEAQVKSGDPNAKFDPDAQLIEGVKFLFDKSLANVFRDCDITENARLKAEEDGKVAKKEAKAVPSPNAPKVPVI